MRSVFLHRSELVFKGLGKPPNQQIKTTDSIAYLFQLQTQEKHILELPRAVEMCVPLT